MPERGLLTDQPLGHLVEQPGRPGLDVLPDPGVGFVITVKPGDWVEAGEPIASVFAKDEAGLRAGALALKEAIRIGEEAEPPLPLISHRVTAHAVEGYTAV